MIYDVTLPLSPELVHWPGDSPVEVQHRQSGAVHLSHWAMGSHAGTHVDAPIHFSRGSRTVEQLDPEVLIGHCTVLHVPDAPIVTADILQSHRLEGVKRLLLRTRNSEHWRDNLTDFDEELVAVDEGAARLLVASGIQLIGVDGLSVAPYRGNPAVHDILLDAGIVILEGLNLGDVPAGDYQLICAPLKLVGSDGAPARVFLMGDVG